MIVEVYSIPDQDIEQKPHAVLHIQVINHPETSYQVQIVGMFQSFQFEDIHTNDQDNPDMQPEEDQIKYNLKITTPIYKRWKSREEEFQVKVVHNLLIPDQVKKVITSMIVEPKTFLLKYKDHNLKKQAWIHLTNDHHNIIKHLQLYELGLNWSLLIFQHHISNQDENADMKTFYSIIERLKFYQYKPFGLHIADVEQFDQFPELEEKELLKSLELYNLPFIQIGLMNNYKIKQKFLLFAPSPDQDSQMFTIGKDPNSTIEIVDKTISRVQSRILYKAQLRQWLIFDGSHFEQSEYGTKIQLQKIYELMNGLPSFVKLREFEKVQFESFVMHIEYKY